jgi:tRNA 2-thiouridine synthesizing protein A
MPQSSWCGSGRQTTHRAADGAGESLDVRGLEPPLPMVRVLERLETLAPGGRLVVLHERRPMFLYPQLEARGFRHATDEPSPGVVRIVIERPPDP